MLVLRRGSGAPFTQAQHNLHLITAPLQCLVLAHEAPSERDLEGLQLLEATECGDDEGDGLAGVERWLKSIGSLELEVLEGERKAVEHLVEDEVVRAGQPLELG